MTYAIIRKGIAEPVSGSFRDEAGISHPGNVLALWSDKALAVIGVYPVIETAIPAGKVSTGSLLAWDDEAETVTRVHTLADAPPPPVPTSCGPAQAKIVLWEYGLIDAVEAMISAHPYRPVSIWYHSATVWERSHPYLTALAYELEMTDEQLDAMFTAAQTE